MLRPSIFQEIQFVWTSDHMHVNSHNLFWFWNTLVFTKWSQIKSERSNEFRDRWGHNIIQNHLHYWKHIVVNVTMRACIIWCNGMKALLSYLTSIFNQISWLHQNQHVGIIPKRVFRAFNRIRNTWTIKIVMRILQKSTCSKQQYFEAIFTSHAISKLANRQV